MSVPLRPSSRVIPAAIEARFSRRNVYTLIIPGPGIPGYGGDWVMWFAERETDSDAQGGVRVYAPLPARKYDLADRDPDPRGLPGSASVQFATVIDKAGHVSSATVLRGSDDAAFRQRALQEMESWEFKPALRNGVPMDVDAVVEIPFRFQSVGGATRVTPTRCPGKPLS